MKSRNKIINKLERNRIINCGTVQRVDTWGDKYLFYWNPQGHEHRRRGSFDSLGKDEKNIALTNRMQAASRGQWKNMSRQYIKKNSV